MRHSIPRSPKKAPGAHLSRLLFLGEPRFLNGGKIIGNYRGRLWTNPPVPTLTCVLWNPRQPCRSSTAALGCSLPTTVRRVKQSAGSFRAQSKGLQLGIRLPLASVLMRDHHLRRARHRDRTVMHQGNEKIEDVIDGDLHGTSGRVYRTATSR